MKKLALIISVVFDPIILLPILYALVVISPRTEWPSLAVTVALAFLYLIFPFAAFLWLLKTKRIKDWWMTRRDDRYLIYFIVLFFHLTGVIVAWWQGYPLLSQALLVFWLITLVLTLANFVTKVSLHAAVSAGLAALLNNWYGWERWWWAWLIVIAVIWSRRALGKHTLWQGIIAVILTLFVYFILIGIIFP